MLDGCQMGCDDRLFGRRFLPAHDRPFVPATESDHELFFGYLKSVQYRAQRRTENGILALRHWLSQCPIPHFPANSKVRSVCDSRAKTR